jgi:hypothetical protein
MKRTGLTDFHEAYADYAKLAALAVPSAAIPFLAQLASVAPPYPRAVAALTAIAQLVAIMMIYQKYKFAGSRTIFKLMKASAIALVFTALIYFSLDAFFSYETPVSGTRWVKGFVCNAEAISVFGQKCPWLDRPELVTAQWDAERLWEFWSIAVMRVVLLAFWIAAFFALSTLVAGFVVYQRHAKA